MSYVNMIKKDQLISNTTSIF